MKNVQLVKKRQLGEKAQSHMTFTQGNWIYKKYIVDDYIGNGSFGEVYSVLNVINQKACAMKVICNELAVGSASMGVFYWRKFALILVAKNQFRFKSSVRSGKFLGSGGLCVRWGVI